MVTQKTTGLGKPAWFWLVLFVPRGRPGFRREARALLYAAAAAAQHGVSSEAGGEALGGLLVWSVLSFCFKGTKETDPLLSRAAALLPACGSLFSPQSPEEGFEGGWKWLGGSRAARPASLLCGPVHR